MKRHTMFLATLALALVVACEKKDEASQATQDPVVATKPAEPTAAAPAPAVADPAAAPAGDLVGVAECDDYIAKYQTCIKSKAPADQQAQLQKAFDDMKTSWRTTAATPEGKTSLAAACKSAMDSAKQATQAWGCEL